MRKYDRLKQPNPPWILGKSNIVLDTIWNMWTPCSRCNITGKRTKLGYCHINLFDDTDSQLGANDNQEVQVNPTLF